MFIAQEKRDFCIPSLVFPHSVSINRQICVILSLLFPFPTQCNTNLSNRNRGAEERHLL